MSQGRCFRVHFFVKHLQNSPSDLETEKPHLTTLQAPSSTGSTSFLYWVKAKPPPATALPKEQGYLGKKVTKKGNYEHLLPSCSLDAPIDCESRKMWDVSHALLFSRLSAQPSTTTRSFWTSITAGWPLMTSEWSECPLAPTNPIASSLLLHFSLVESRCTNYRDFRQVSPENHIRTGRSDEMHFALGHQTSFN